MRSLDSAHTFKQLCQTVDEAFLYNSQHGKRDVSNQFTPD